MARSFTNDDARFLINKISALMEKRARLTEQYDSVKKQVRKDAVTLLKSNVYSKLISDQLTTGVSNASLQPNEKALIRSAFDCMQISQQMDQLEILKQKYDQEMKQLVSILQSGASPMKWFFSSRAAKENIEEAYFRLDKIDKSEYSQVIEETQKRIDEIHQLATEPICANLDQYSDKLLNVIHQLEPNSLRISELNPAGEKLTRLIEIEERYRAAQNIGSERKTFYRNNAIEAIKKAVAEQAVKDLETYDVETLLQVKTGIRVKALRDRGYDNIAKVHAAHLYSIAGIHGIGNESAKTIKKAAAEIASTVQRTSKLKLSTDDRSPQATGLIITLFIYEQTRQCADEYEKKINETQGVTNKSFENIRQLQNNIDWAFANKRKKELWAKEYDGLQQLLTGEYPNTVDEYLGKINRNITPTPDFAWDDFAKRSFLYFNLIEELAPGVLGNNDALYGLPEELAREIQDQSFFPQGLKVTLRRYQEWGVKYTLHQGRVLLGDEMGLGKTVQAIATMVSLRNTGAKHFMVICPASVLPNWCKEVETKSHLRAIKVHGYSRQYALKEWMENGGVAITTYETLNTIELEPGFMFDFLVVDEAHYIKNEGAIRSQNVRNLGNRTGRILYMTGTALENKVDEMISLIQALQPSIANKARQIAFMSTAPQFRQMIAPVYYRRKREDVLTELPAITEIKEWCDLLPEERGAYRQAVMARDRSAIRKVSWNMENLSKSSKARRLQELVQEAEEDGRKILVFSFYLETIQRVIELLGTRCTAPINGSVQVERRQQIIDEFESMPAGAVLPAQIQAGGTGLNIQAASVVIICEPQLKPSIENQAISRAYRMGQTRKVLVYRLLAVNTIDERIDEMLTEKQAIFNAFADISAAAASTQNEERQIDDKTFGKLIQEEIDRINRENQGSEIHQSNETNYVQSIYSEKTVNPEVEKTKSPGKQFSETRKQPIREPIPVTETTQPVSRDSTMYSQKRMTDVELVRMDSIDGLLKFVRRKGGKIVDNRPKNGCLWIRSEPMIDPVMKTIKIKVDDIEKQFGYASSTRAFDGKAGWYI